MIAKHKQQSSLLALIAPLEDSEASPNRIALQRLLQAARVCDGYWFARLGYPASIQQHKGSAKRDNRTADRRRCEPRYRFLATPLSRITPPA